MQYPPPWRYSTAPSDPPSGVSHSAGRPPNVTGSMATPSGGAADEAIWAMASRCSGMVAAERPDSATKALMISMPVWPCP